MRNQKYDDSIYELVVENISMDEFMKKGISLTKLIVYAEKNHYSKKFIDKLEEKHFSYILMNEEFDMKKYLSNAYVVVDDMKVRPTKEDVLKCIDKLKEEGKFICNYNIANKVSAYIKNDRCFTVEELKTKKRLKQIEHMMKLKKKMEEKI